MIPSWDAGYSGGFNGNGRRQEGLANRPIVSGNLELHQLASHMLRTFMAADEKISLSKRKISEHSQKVTYLLLI